MPLPDRFVRKVVRIRAAGDWGLHGNDFKGPDGQGNPGICTTPCYGTVPESALVRVESGQRLDDDWSTNPTTFVGSEAVVLVEVTGAHGELRRQHPVTDPQLRSVRINSDLPTGWTQTLQWQQRVALLHLEGFEMADVIADQIGAGGPAGQAQAQLCEPGQQLQLDPDQMATGIAQIEMDVDHSGVRAPAGCRHRATPAQRSPGRGGRHSGG